MSSAAYIGRVGSLAVALGIGTAVATGYGVAAAEPGDPTPPSQSSSSSDETSSKEALKTSSPAESQVAASQTSAAPKSTTRQPVPATKMPPDAMTSTPWRTPSAYVETTAPSTGGPTVASTNTADLKDASTPHTPTAPSTTTEIPPTIASPVDGELSDVDPGQSLPVEPKPPSSRGTVSVPARKPEGATQQLLQAMRHSTPTEQPATMSATRIAAVPGVAKDIPQQPVATSPSTATNLSIPTTAKAAPPATNVTVTPTPVVAPPPFMSSLTNIVSHLLTTFGFNPVSASNPMMPTPPPPTLWGIVEWARRQALQWTSYLNANTQRSAVVQTPQTTQSTAALAANTVIPGDQTAALQAKFDALKSGETLNLEPSTTYQHSGNLYIRVAGVTINGNGATLQSTNPATSAIWVKVDNVTISNLNLTAPLGLARNTAMDRSGLVIGHSGVIVRNVTVVGGSSVGIYLVGATNFLLDHVVVKDTGADGIQIYNGAHNGQINYATTLRTGDDGIAIVSYQGGKLAHDIVVNNPVVNGSTQRGLVVTGGQNITFNNIHVSNTALSGVFVGNQTASSAAYHTQSATNISVNGGTIKMANSSSLQTGAITVLSQNPLATVNGVTMSDVKIVDTYSSAGGNIGHALLGGGDITNVAYRKIAIVERNSLPPMFTNAPGTYTATGFTMNGTPIAVS